MSARKPSTHRTRENLRSKVEREMKAYARKTRWPYLNNFHCRLPGGLYRKILEEEDLDRPYAREGASRRLRAMTPRSFFALIDRLIGELGLDIGAILRLQDAGTRDIYEYAFPVYLRLREKGFKHYPDLTS